MDMSKNENTAYTDLIKQWNDKQNEQTKFCCEQFATLRKQMESTGALKKNEWVRFLAIYMAELAKKMMIELKGENLGGRKRHKVLVVQ